jgi:uncharacterized protein
MAMKYLLLLALLGVVWWSWKKRNEQPPAERSARPDPAPEKMLTCAHCGVHMPESDALTDGAQRYCCAEHRDAARSKRP